jgi:hypothetical protein
MRGAGAHRAGVEQIEVAGKLHFYLKYLQSSILNGAASSPFSPATIHAVNQPEDGVAASSAWMRQNFYSTKKCPLQNCVYVIS